MVDLLPVTPSTEFFSETEKSDALDSTLREIDEDEGIDDDEMEERCSELWNQIKDAMVLQGRDLTHSFLDHLCAQSQLLADQVQQLVSRSDATSQTNNAQLRLASVQSALEELRRKKEKEETEKGGGPLGVAQFRRWLLHRETDLTRIRDRIPCSKKRLALLRDLEQDQRALQAQIETEGRAGYQQLCSQQTDTEFEEHDQRQPQSSESRRLCEVLEHRYLALWLASLEGLELINHFKARCAKNCPVDQEDDLLLVSEFDEGEEEGPDPKRRKTSIPLDLEDAEAQEDWLNKGSELNSVGEKEERMAPTVLNLPSAHIEMPASPGKAKLSATMSDGSSSRHDFGYSSDTPTDHTTNTEGGAGEQKLDEAEQQTLWAEHLAQSSELEKSFYRTVPLDEFGMTDTDEGVGSQTRWPRASYLAQKFMDELDSTGQRLELTDSLIVHVDTPEAGAQQLNDFEEVMGLLDQQILDQQQSARQTGFSSDDECESQSTESGLTTAQTAGVGGSRKRARPPPTLAHVAMSTPKQQQAEMGEEGEERQRKHQHQQRRKWAARRKDRLISSSGCSPWRWTSPYLSSDFEWDHEDFVGSAARKALGHEDEDQLPDIICDSEEAAVALARKKALCTFREGLRRAAAESGNVSIRLRELLALVDKSLGGVDSAGFLLAELNNTLKALSGLCHSLEQRQSHVGGAMINDQDGRHQTEQIKGVESELMLCHERMNALETTCNNLALLLGSHLNEGDCLTTEGSSLTEDNRHYLAQFAAECQRIGDELQKLKSRFGEKFVLSIHLPATKTQNNEDMAGHNGPSQSSLSVSVQTNLLAVHSTSESLPAAKPHVVAASSFWRSYLLLCVFGFVVFTSTMLFAGSQAGTDWRWTFGPQLNYRDGPPPF